MAAVQLVDTATSAGIYGNGGINGSYFKLSNITGTSLYVPPIPISFYVYIDGSATVQIQGSPTEDGVLVDVSGASYTSSVQDGCYATLEYFAFQLSTVSGSVDIWLVY